MKFDRLKHVISSPIFISSIIALGIMVSGYMIINVQKNINAGPEKEAESKKTIFTEGDKDTDKDGLPDWIEAAYLTDSSLSDTDGDGTNDGEEIVLGRDPRKKGPDDYFDKLYTIASTTDPVVAKNLFLESFIGNQARAIQAQVTNNLVSKFDVNQIKDRYSLTDLTVTFDNSTTSIRAYGNALGAALLKYKYSGTKNETKIIEEALKTKKPSDLQKLELSVIQYRDVSNDLRKISVPSSLSKDHLIIVNAYDVMGRGLLLFTKFFQDPIAGGAGWQAYYTKGISIAQGYFQIIDSLIKHKIVYLPEETGYYIQSKVK